MTTFNRIDEINERIDEIKERLNEIATKMNDIVKRMNCYSIDFYNEYDICVSDFTYALNEYIIMLCDDRDTEQRKWIHECKQSTQYIDEALRELEPNNLNSYTVIRHAQYLYYSDLLYKDYSKLEELKGLHEERGGLERELKQELEQVA